MSCLVVADHVNGELRDVTLELVSAACEFGPTAVIVIGRDPSALADQVDVAGVAEILLVEAGTDDFDSELYRSTLVDVVKERQPKLVFVAASANGVAYAGAVAAQVGFGFAADVHGLRSEDGNTVAIRSFYGGKVHAELEFPDREGILLSLREGVWEAPSGPGHATRTILSVRAPERQIEHLDLAMSSADDGVELTHADLILAVGRGIGGQENLEVFESLAATMGASLAVSRPLVDAGWAPASRQVGRSGKTVKPKLYLAFGISGAPEHLAGVQASEAIVAVNTDPDAAIFNVASYTGVFDALALARELDSVYSNRQQGVD